MRDRNRALNQFRLDLRLGGHEVRSRSSIVACAPLSCDPSNADGKNGERSLAIDVQFEEVFPILNRQRRKGLIAVPTEPIEGNQKIAS